MTSAIFPLINPTFRLHWENNLEGNAVCCDVNLYITTHCTPENASHSGAKTLQA